MTSIHAAAFRRAALGLAVALPAGLSWAGDMRQRNAPGQQAASAQQQTAPRFVVVNRSNRLVNVLNVSPSSSDQWGDDLLGLLQITPGSAVAVNLPRGSECRQDVRVIYQDNSVEAVGGIDACAGQQVVFDGSNARVASR
jgi:hypothetical protein